MIARDAARRASPSASRRAQPRQGVARREPRQQQRAAAAQQHRVASRRSLVALVIVAAAVVAIVLSIQPSAKVQLHPSGFSGDFQSVLSQLNSLIDANTL